MQIALLVYVWMRLYTLEERKSLEQCPRCSGRFTCSDIKVLGARRLKENDRVVTGVLSRITVTTDHGYGRILVISQVQRKESISS